MTLRGRTQRELKGGRAPVLGQIGRISASMRLFGSTLSNFGGMHLHVKNCIQERFKIVVSVLAPGSGSGRLLRACVLALLCFAIQRLLSAFEWRRQGDSCHVSVRWLLHFAYSGS